MTPAAALDRARALLDQPAPAPMPGQITMDDPRPITPAGEPEPLFDLAVYEQALADVRALRPYGTYRTKAARLPAVERDECGTRSGYRLHLKAGEETCERCRGANAAADRRLRGTGTRAEVTR